MEDLGAKGFGQRKGRGPQAATRGYRRHAALNFFSTVVLDLYVAKEIPPKALEKHNHNTSAKCQLCMLSEQEGQVNGVHVCEAGVFSWRFSFPTAYLFDLKIPFDSSSWSLYKR